jgi:hypothetical protein
MKKLLFLLIVLIFANLDAQSVTYNEEFQVSNYDYSQGTPFVTNLKDGGFVICWQSYEQDGSGYGIYAQVYNENGDKVENEFQVNTYTNGWQDAPNACGLATGGFVICWQRELGSNGIYAQIYNENGAKVGNEFQVNTYTYYGLWPSIYGLANGGFVICWDSYEQDGSSTDIYAQIYNENGDKVGNEFQVNTYAKNVQSSPSICGLKNGEFVICWDSYEQDGSSTDIYAQIYNENGDKVGNEFQVNTYTNNAQSSPSVSGLTNGGFIICWNSYEQDGSGYGIYAQVYNENGDKVENEFQVNTYTNNWQASPSICGLTNGGFVICWQSMEQDGSNNGIYTQIYNENGAKVGNEFQVNTYTNSWQAVPSTCGLKNGEFVICWEGIGQIDTWGIFGKYYLGSPLKHTLINYEIYAPQNDESLISINPVFNWGKASNIRLNFPWELTYDLYISTNNSFTESIIITGIKDTTYQIDSLTLGSTYFWKVLAKNYYGDSLWSSNVNGFYIDQNATDVKQIDQTVPEIFKVKQNYPNPFNPTTTIKYSLNVETFIRLNVFDVLGMLVKVLVNETQKPGNYSFEFDGSNLSSGIYYYTVTVGEFGVTKKMLLLK